MRYFLDTEFAEKPNTIKLISIGIVAEDGRQFYAESSDFNPDHANEWVKQNVLPNLWHTQKDKSMYNAWSLNLNKNRGGLMLTSEIGPEIRRWIGDDKPEFWGYYADYDWVVFCWLFGSMIDLPKGWPMYCRDLKQLSDDLGIRLPPNENSNHVALDDALWIRKSFEFLQNEKG